MIALGTVIHDQRGHRYGVDHELGVGGQATAYEVAHIPSATPYVLKVPHDGTVTRDMRERWRSLIALNLSTYSPALCGPLSLLHPDHGAGTIQPKVGGVPLEAAFEAPDWSLLDGLLIAAMVAEAVALLDALGVAHGDLAATNVLLDRVRGAYRVSLIDFDNAALPGVPAPELAGQTYYAAPELLLGRATASVASDRFALAVLLHEVLLLRHPFTSLSTGLMDHDAYLRFLNQARWLEDPVHRSVALPAGSLPVGVLPRAMQQLFRRALQPDATQRPTAADWAKALRSALTDCYQCDCGGEFVNSLTRRACPYCGAVAPVLELRLPKATIPLTEISTTIGRKELGGDPTISREHVVFRRSGFSLTATCRSANGMAVHTGGDWKMLKVGDEVAVGAGDRVVFATGVEGHITAKRA